MHSALIIDEVLEAMLEHCADWSGADYRWTLCQLARCCKAWKDPALDRLWKRLDAVEPLNRLGCTSETETPEKQVISIPLFANYASRVKHIVLKSPLRYPDISLTHIPLPNLKSITIRGDGCLIQPQCLASPLLQDLDVDLRGTRDVKCGHPKSHALSKTLESVSSLQMTLQKLRIKGFMPAKLERIIPSFSSLRSLTLLTGQSLSAETLAAMSHFTSLQDIYIHASHIDADEFTHAISSHISQPFPSLRSLRIRAQRSLFCAILDVLPHDTLESLYLETEDPAQGPSAWNTTFTLIALKASDTLVDLTLDQILDLEEMDANLSTSGTDTRLALETLQPLSKLRVLHRLTIDAMLLPDFTDRDVDQMATWWPELEHLDLGELPDVQEHAGTPKITTKALYCLAKRCPNLRSLSIPLDSSNCTDELNRGAKNTVRQKVLERLIVGPPPADKHIAAFVRSILEIFPGVKEIECTHGEKSLSMEVQTVFKEHPLNVEYPKGTSDGFANGQ